MPTLPGSLEQARSLPDAAPDGRRGEPPRIRFLALRVSRANSGRCRAEVELESVRGTRVVGASDVEPSAAGDLRAAAAATLEALHRAAADDGAAAHRFVLLGVKSVRAFDQSVALVQIALETASPPTRLVGSAFADGDVMRAMVLAVLNASNRVLWTPGRD